jgi:hypothetical protein
LIDNGSVSRTTISGISTDTFQNYRVVVNDIDKEIYYYVNEVLEATKTYSSWTMDSDISIALAIKSQTTSNDHVAYVGNTIFLQDF